MKHIAAGLIILLLPATMHSQMHCRDNAIRGDPHLVRILLPEPVDSIAGRLLSDDGKTVIEAPGFYVGGGEWGCVYAVLLGLPSTMRGGTYRLEVEAVSGDLLYRGRKDIEIEGKQFPFEKIRLNVDLTDLLTRRDPKKTAEARFLHALLREVNGDAVFHLDRFRLPIEEERRTAGFGDVRQYLFPDGGSWRSIHNGVDFGLPTGTAVYACGAGRAAMARKRITTGNTIVLEHLPGVYSLYYHLDELGISEGDTVRAGQEIGKVGSTGLATGAHLHWEVRWTGVAVDPDALVQATVVDMRSLSDILYKHPIMEGGEQK